jgi:hypothetical protein
MFLTVARNGVPVQRPHVQYTGCVRDVTIYLLLFNTIAPYSVHLAAAKKRNCSIHCSFYAL